MQATVTDTWRRKVLEEHRLLNEAVARMRTFLEQERPKVGKPGSHTWAADLSRQLVDLHDLLCRHFRFEEKGGMMEELMQNHPRATGQVDSLIDEHSELLAESRQLIGVLLAYSEDSATADVRLRRRLTVMLDRLAEHEHQENALIMDLAYHDLGLGD